MSGVNMLLDVSKPRAIGSTGEGLSEDWVSGKEFLATLPTGHQFKVTVKDISSLRALGFEGIRFWFNWGVSHLEVAF